MTITRLFSAMGVAAIATISLAGCSGSTTVTAYEVDPAVAPAGCDTLVEPAVVDRIEAEGGALDPAWPDEVPAHPLSVFYSLFVETGGVSCQWETSDGLLVYSAVEADAVQRDEARRLLVELGFVSTTRDGVVVFRDPGNPIEFAVTDTGVFGVAGAGSLGDIVGYPEHS